MITFNLVESGSECPGYQVVGNLNPEFYETPESEEYELCDTCVHFSQGLCKNETDCRGVD